MGDQAEVREAEPMPWEEFKAFAGRCEAWGFFWGPQIAHLIERFEATEKALNAYQEREATAGAIHSGPENWRDL